MVVVNYGGAEDTIACLRAFQHDIDWPAERLELIVVDNASGAGQVDALKNALSGVRIVESPTNIGFAGGCNVGVRHSHGEYVAFVNNDARPHALFAREAVGCFERHADVAAVASKVLDWRGETIDFAAAGLSWYGQGFKLNVGEPAADAPSEERDVLFGSGSALTVRRAVFDDVGGFDERYFMFFEDVDLGWRLWLLGHRVRYVPTSVVFHKHHASMSGIGQWREQFLLERNALYTIYKNYDERNLAAFLPGAMALAMRRGVILGESNPRSVDMAYGIPPQDPPTMNVSKTTLASAYAIDAFVTNLPSLTTTRRELQGRRVRSDGEILRLFTTPMMPNIADAAFLHSYEAVVDAFSVGNRFAPRRRIVVATGDTLSERMAGPAIRAWQIARALADEHDVVLVTTEECTLTHPQFRVRRVDEQDVIELERWCDVIIFQGYLMQQNPVLRASDKVIVVDIYDPFHLEQLEQARDLDATARRDIVRSATATLNEQIQRGDFFLCASAKQRDFWLGQLTALGRVNPLTYDEDETLESLITTVPFGVSDDSPLHTRQAVKGVLPGIGEDDELILWGGGIYNWFDPLTLIRAMASVVEQRPRARLLFMGGKHPNPTVPEMRMAVDARALADALGLLDKSVFFNTDWVAYDDRQNYLLEADIGVSTHLDHVETAFSFRTRILDYLWTRLPIVCTDGDALADLVTSAGLGRAVPPGDPAALADALIDLLGSASARQACAANIAAVTPDLRWSVVLQPLLEFCRSPRRAPDLLNHRVGRRSQPLTVVAPPWEGLTGDLRLAATYVRRGGVRLAVRKATGRLKRLARGDLRSR